jgi:hypothetical protein
MTASRRSGRLLFFLFIAVLAAVAGISAGPARFPDMEAVMRDAGEARAALARGDGAAAMAPLTRLLAVAPDHPGLLFSLARARARRRDRAGALAALEKAAAMGFALDAPGDPPIRTIASADRARFERVFARIRENRRPVPAARERFTIAERDLIPEGVAWDETSRRLFVSSLYKRKVVVIDAAGVARDFVAEGAGGLWQVLGMKVDSRRKRLLVCSAAEKTMRGFDPADRGRSGVFSFDLASGALMAKAIVPPDAATHLFNDLALTEDGAAYVTDSEEGSVWRLDPSGSLERVFPARSFLYPNGISLSPDGRFLYVASFSGIDRVDLGGAESGGSRGPLRRRPLPHPENVTLCGVDGLSFWRGRLLAVQNGIQPSRIVEIPLSPAFDRALGLRVLDRLDPLVTDATTAAVAGDELLVIANAQIGSFDADGKIFPDERLEPVRIVSISLSLSGNSQAPGP